MKTLIALLVAAVALPFGAGAAADRSSGTLNVNTTISTGYRLGQNCPPGTPPTTEECIVFTGAGGIPGLGRATVTYVKSFDETICPGQVVGQRTSLIDVGGKGQLKVAMDFPYCANRARTAPCTEGRSSRGPGCSPEHREASRSPPPSRRHGAAPVAAGFRPAIRGQATCRCRVSRST